MKLCAFPANQLTATCCTSAAANVLSSICEFYEYQCREGCTFHRGVNKLHLCVYCETVWYFETKESHGKVCVLMQCSVCSLIV